MLNACAHNIIIYSAYGMVHDVKMKQRRLDEGTILSVIAKQEYEIE